LKLENLLQEGSMAGLSLWDMEDMTWGEIVQVISAQRERLRRESQNQAVIAYRQAGLIAKAVLEGKLPELWEAFPFWNEKEVKEMRLEKYRHIMEKYAERRRGKELE
jgi:hypothetical protein